MTAATARRRSLAGMFLVLALIVFGAPWTSQVVSAQSRSFFLSVTDAEGAPVTDMKREEVIVEADGERTETLSLEPIDWPVRVSVFVDNGMASPPILDHIREGVRLFIEALPPEVEVQIGTTGGRPQILARYTNDRAELTNAIGSIAPDMEGAASFFDALYEEAERLDEDAEGQYFPVIVMVATNGPEGSTRVREGPFNEMIQRIMANNVTLHTRLYTFTSISGVKQGGDQARWGMDIGKHTGGSYEGLSTAIGFRTQLPELAEDLARKHRLMSNQYRLTYDPPEGADPNGPVRVLTTRGDINMMATANGNVP